MKKWVLLFAVLIFVVVVNALTNYYDPVSDVTTGWDDGNGITFDEINDAVRAPNLPDSSTNLQSRANDGLISEFNFNSVGESAVNNITLWIYVDNGVNAEFSFELQQGGVSRCSSLAGTLSLGWKNCVWDTPSGDFSSMTIELGICNKNGPGSPTNCRVDAAYLEVDYVLESDEEFPLFTNLIENPLNNTEYVQGRIYSFNSTIKLTNGTAGIEFDGVNYTATNLSDMFNVSIFELGVGSYNYYWWAYGNGTDNNYNLTGLRGYTVVVNTTGNQIIPLLNGNNANLTVVYPQQINASYSGNNQTEVVIEIDGIQVNIGENYTLGAGSWVVNYSALQNNNYSSYETYLNMTVDRAVPNGNISVTPSLSVEYGVETNAQGNEDNEGDGDLVYYLFRDNVSVSNPEIDVLGVGSYHYKFNVSGGNNYTSNFSLGEAVLEVTQNGSYVLDLSLSPSSSEDFGVETIANGTGCPSGLTCNLHRDGVVVSNPETITLGVGAYNYTYNTSGNVNYSSKGVSDILTISQISSEVNLTLNNTEFNITVDEGSTILLNGTLITGDSGGILRLFNDGNLLNEGIIEVSNNTLFDTVGLFNITVIYVSSQNYSQSSETYYVNVTSVLDTEYPSITNLIENPNGPVAYVQGQIYYFNATVTDNAEIDKVLIEFEGVNYTISASGDVYSFNISDLSAGNYSYYWWANDTSGNVNKTEVFNYAVQKASPDLTFKLNDTEGNIEFVFGSQVNASASSLTSQIEILRDGFDVTSENDKFVSLGVGYYNYTVNAFEGNNYTSLSIARFLNVTVAGGNINLFLNGNEGNVTISYPQESNITATTLFGSLVVYRNGADITGENGLNISVGSGFYNITAVSSGDQNHSSDSATYYFNVSKAISVCSITSNSPITYPNSINVIGNCSNFEENYYLYRDGVEVNGENGVNVSLGAGNYDYIVNVSETQNYTSASASESVIVNPAIGRVQTFLNHSRSDITIKQGNSIYLNGTLVSGEGEIFLYNDGILINQGSENLSNLTIFSVLGLFNVTTVYPETQNYTFDSETWWVNVSKDVNLILICEIGGPYQKGALVLVHGNLSNETSGLSGVDINLSFYDSNNNLNVSKIVLTDSDGDFDSSFNDFGVGRYILNVNATYLGTDVGCIDILEIGSPASFVMDKIASIHNTTDNDISYNITLRLINSGGADAEKSNVTDLDSSDSPYLLGIVSDNSTFEMNYVVNFTRQNSTTYYLLDSAVAYGMDTYNNSLIFASSTKINLTIPGAGIGRNILIVKNVEYFSEESLNVTYNVSSILYNSGSENLIDIIYIDTDINGSAIFLNLSVGSSKKFSKLVVIDKAADNTEHTFALGTATVGTDVFYSNIPVVSISGYGGPADAIVYAPASVETSTEFDTIIEVRNINPDIGQDFVVDYWITNVGEDVNYTSGQQTIFVSAEGSSNLTASLVSPEIEGNYRFRAFVTWAGGTATSFDTFGVITGGGSGESDTGGGVGGSGGSTSGGSSSGFVVDEPEGRQDGETDKEGPVEEVPEEKPDEDRVGRITGFFGFEDIIGRIFNVNIFLIVLIIILLGLIVFFVFRRYRTAKYVEGNLLSLKRVKGMKVYSIDGYYVGNVSDIFLEEYKVKELKVKFSKKLKLRKKGAVVSYRNVKNIGDVVILDEYVLSKIRGHVKNNKT